MKLVNVTAHNLNLINKDGSEIVLSPSGIVINAKVSENVEGHNINDPLGGTSDIRAQYADGLEDRMIKNNITYVSQAYVGNEEGEALIARAINANLTCAGCGADVEMNEWECHSCGRYGAKEYPLLIGSFIAAEAYPGKIVSPILTTETARLPLDQKKAYAYKFNVASGSL